MSNIANLKKESLGKEQLNKLVANWVTGAVILLIIGFGLVRGCVSDHVPGEVRTTVRSVESRPTVEYNQFNEWSIPPTLEWVVIPTNRRNWDADSNDYGKIVARYKLMNGMYYSGTGGVGGAVINRNTHLPHFRDIVAIEVRQTKSSARCGKEVKYTTLRNKV